jgi:exopolyphosphatase
VRLTAFPKAQSLISGASSQAEPVPTLQEFLSERRQSPTTNFVIGNEAGDADTIVSSIVLAYVESVQGGAEKTPVVAIDKVDLQTQRPEVRFLFKLAGISPDSLICVDDPVFLDAQSATLTLTDHNRLAAKFQDRTNWTVVEIVDHHQDEGDYTDSCSGEARTIAFADDKALAASACTLVAERLFELWVRPPYPAPVGLLLLGVILLDSVGLSEEVGKVTDRDRDAVKTLVIHTDWSGLPESSMESLNLFTSTPSPDPEKFFELLQDSKYDKGFWDALCVQDALRQDYKSFPCTNGFAFGISSVLMPSNSFSSKPHLVDDTLDYMQQVNVTFLAIMFAFQDDESQFSRQLAFCGLDSSSVDGLAEYLTSKQGREPLELQELEVRRGVNDAPKSGLWVRVFEQTNVVPSRKQIGPILEEYFESR